MLANTHRRHLVSNRLALATGLVLLLAQSGQWAPENARNSAPEVQPVAVEAAEDSGKSYYNVLLDLGLLLIKN